MEEKNLKINLEQEVFQEEERGQKDLKRNQEDQIDQAQILDLDQDLEDHIGQCQEKDQELEGHMDLVGQCQKKDQDLEDLMDRIDIMAQDWKGLNQNQKLKSKKIKLD